MRSMTIAWCAAFALLCIPAVGWAGGPCDGALSPYSVDAGLFPFNDGAHGPRPVCVCPQGACTNAAHPFPASACNPSVLGSSSQAFALSGGPVIKNGVCVFAQIPAGLYGYTVPVYVGYYLAPACPANAIQTTVNGTAFCCTTSDGASVGSTTNNFCCNKMQ